MRLLRDDRPELSKPSSPSGRFPGINLYMTHHKNGKKTKRYTTYQNTYTKKKSPTKRATEKAAGGDRSELFKPSSPQGIFPGINLGVGIGVAVFGVCVALVFLV
jgi:hypothetical protein